jgi:phage tail sheath gpL-like
MNGLITAADYARVTEGNFASSPSLLSQRIAVLCEPNTSLAAAIDENDSPFSPISESDVINRLGAGSPGHLMYKYFSSLTLPVVYFPQKYSTAPAPTHTVAEVAVTGTATEATQLLLSISSKVQVVDIAKGATNTEVAQLIADLASASNASPVLSSATTGTATLTTKWKGATSAALKVTVKPAPNKTLAGLSFVITTTAGTGTPDITSALEAMSEDHYTIIVNPYGEAKFADLENFIGYPDPTLNIGNWGADIARPGISFFGSLTNTAAAAAAITDVEARKKQLANAAVSAPGTEWFPFEAAASGALLFAQTSNSAPHMGVVGRALPFCPPPVNGMGDFKTIKGRNAVAMLGHSTSEWVNGQMLITDLITTYHPDGDEAPKFRNVRDVMAIANVLFAVKELQKSYRGAVVTASGTVVNVENIISDIAVKSDLRALCYFLGGAGLVATPAFSAENAAVTINPARRINIKCPFALTSEITQTSSNVIIDYYVSI